MTSYLRPLLSGLAVLTLAACTPSGEEILQPYYAGRLELITTLPVQGASIGLDPRSPVVFRWQPRSHNPLIDMPSSLVVVVPKGSGSGQLLPARVEQVGPVLEVTVLPGAHWSGASGEVRLGVAMGMGDTDDVRERLKASTLTPQDGAGALMSCDPLKGGWRLCWLDGTYSVAR